MTPAQTRALIAHQLRRLQTQEIEIRDGITLMRQQQMEFRRNMTMANRWGFVAVLSHAILIPLHVITNALDPEGQHAFEDLVEATISSVQLVEYRRYGHVTVKETLEKLKPVIAKSLKKRKMGDYLPGVAVLIGLAEDSASLLETALEVSEGDSRMSAEDRGLERMIERTMERAIAALRELQVKEARLRRLAASALPALHHRR